MPQWSVRVRSFDDNDFSEVVAWVPFKEILFSLELSGPGGGSCTFDLDSEFLQNGDVYEQLTERENLWEFLFDGVVVAQFIADRFEINYVTADLSRSVTVSGPGLLDAYRRIVVLPKETALEEVDGISPVSYPKVLTGGTNPFSAMFWESPDWGDIMFGVDATYMGYWHDVAAYAVKRQDQTKSPAEYIQWNFDGQYDSNLETWGTRGLLTEAGTPVAPGLPISDFLIDTMSKYGSDFFLRPLQDGWDALTNLDFEGYISSGDIPSGSSNGSGWYHYYSGTATVDLTGGEFGGKAAKISTVGDDSASTLCSEVFVVSPLTIVRVEARIRSNIVLDPAITSDRGVYLVMTTGTWGGTPPLRVAPLDGGGEVGDTEYVDTDWITISCDFTMPVNASYASAFVEVVSDSGIGAADVYVDWVKITRPNRFAALEVALEFGTDYSDSVTFFDSNVFSKKRLVEVSDIENVVQTIEPTNSNVYVHQVTSAKSIEDWGRREKYIAREELSNETVKTPNQVAKNRVDQYREPVTSWVVEVAPYVTVPDGDEEYIINRAGVDYTVGDYVGIADETSRHLPRTALPLQVRILSGRVDQNGDYKVELTLESVSQLTRRLPTGETRRLTSFAGLYQDSSAPSGLFTSLGSASMALLIHGSVPATEFSLTSSAISYSVV